MDPGTPLEELESFLDQLVDSLDRGRAAPGAFNMLHAGRALRTAEGGPIAGLEGAMWGGLLDPPLAHWELVVDGRVVARVFAPHRGGPWSYQIFAHQRPRASPAGSASLEAVDVLQGESAVEEEARTRRNVGRAEASLQRAEEATDEAREAYVAGPGEGPAKRDYEEAISAETDARRAHRDAERKATEARARRRAEDAERRPDDAASRGERDHRTSGRS